MNSRRSGSTPRAAVVLAALFLAAACAEADDPAEEVRPPCCAGSWYPGDSESLGDLVDGLLERASPPGVAGKPVALISPHAGYRFSGPVAAAGYASLPKSGYKRVIVLAFSHRYAAAYEGVDVPDELTAYQTPLGPVPIDREVCNRLLKTKVFSSHSGIDRGEHSLELQLPFLQRVTAGFKLVPVLVGRMSLEDYTAAAEAILPFLDEETLLVASSDFTHFGANYGYQPFSEDVPTKLQERGDQAGAPLLNADFDGFADHLKETEDTICGRSPILLLLRTLSMQGGAAGVRAAFDTSGRITGDWTHSVTYQSFVYTRRPGNLNKEERQTLLRLARQTITAHLNHRELPKVDSSELTSALRLEGASFVTLENHGRLRGCIGNVVPNGPLWESVLQNSVKACQDFRFERNPVTAGELNDLEVEVSYLTPLKPISSIDEIVVGRDGLVMTLGRNAGLLLPQVAYELGWARQEFLAQACLKAGLPVDAWKRPDAVLYSFQAEVFGESGDTDP